jgi:hypothetical protein
MMITECRRGRDKEYSDMQLWTDVMEARKKDEEAEMKAGIGCDEEVVSG